MWQFCPWSELCGKFVCGVSSLLSFPHPHIILHSVMLAWLHVGNVHDMY